MYIYAFGSVCRGEIDSGSDIDLLAIVEGYDKRFDPNLYSIYTLKRLSEIWEQGNPFAWHLSLESKLIFATNGVNILDTLGEPNTYKNVKRDCLKFYKIFKSSFKSLKETDESITFDLSTVFLAIRNISTCYSLSMCEHPDFSRHSAKRLKENSIPIPEESYKIFERARILCTRGYGRNLSKKDIEKAVKNLDTINLWMQNLIISVGLENYE